MQQAEHALLRRRYGRGFRSLLWRLHIPRLEATVAQHLAAAQENESHAAPARAFQRRYAQARGMVIERLVQRAAAGAGAERGVALSARRRLRQLEVLLEATLPPEPPSEDADFHCDAGLGGLARWLRAAGYDARFWPGVDDDQLLAKLSGSCAILLTNDRRLMQRGVVQQAVVPALHVSHTLTKQGQLRFVLQTLGLPRQPARCMTCGGELLPVDKEVVRERIPPRTYPWLDDYYLCVRCGQLFWEGSHWQRIHAALGRAEWSGD